MEEGGGLPPFSSSHHAAEKMVENRRLSTPAIWSPQSGCDQDQLEMGGGGHCSCAQVSSSGHLSCSEHAN